jgi:hypothetical protein
VFEHNPVVYNSGVYNAVLHTGANTTYAGTFSFEATTQLSLTTGGTLFLNGACQIGASGSTPVHIFMTATTSTATAGAATLPSNPRGFISVNINGSARRIPYYDP